MDEVIGYSYIGLGNGGVVVTFGEVLGSIGIFLLYG